MTKERRKGIFESINFTKSVKDAIHGYIHLTDLELLIIDSPLFQRLRGITQSPFGAMVYPTHSVRRFEHSLGTMHLAGRLIETVLRNSDDEIKKEYFKEFVKDIRNAVKNGDGEGEILSFLQDQDSIMAEVFNDNENENLLKNKEILGALKNILIQLSRIMGLLHDIGHLPFSHLGEEIIEEVMSEINDTGKEVFINKVVPLFSFLKKSYPNEVLPIHELNTYYIATKLLEEYAEKNLSRGDDGLLKELKFYSCLLRKAMNKLEIKKSKAFRTLLGFVDNDIDVDRADYFLRDGITSGIGFGSYDLERLLGSMRLVIKKGDFIIRPNTSGVSAVETFVTERFKLHRWFYFHPMVILFETCFKTLLTRIVKAYKDSAILEMFYLLDTNDAVMSSFIHPEADIVTRIKNHYLTIRKKETIEPEDKVFLALYNVIYFKKKFCRPLWQKQGDYYINFHKQIENVARERNVPKARTPDIHKYIHDYFKDLALDLDKRKEVVKTLEDSLNLNGYYIIVAGKRFRPLKSLPPDTDHSWQYEIVHGDSFLGIDEYPLIRAIEETWYKEIPMHIFIVSKNDSEITREARDNIQKKVVDFFLNDENKTKFSLQELGFYIKSRNELQ